MHRKGTIAMRVGLSYQRNTNCAETPIALSGWMVCTAQALVLCGIWAFVSTKHQLRRVAGWIAQYRHYCYVGFGLSYQ